MLLAAVSDALKSVPTTAWVTGGGAGLIAFLAGLAFANGVLKQIFNMLALAAGVSVAWYCFRHRTDIFGPSAASMGTDRLVWFSAIAGGIAFVLARIGVQLLSVLGFFRLFAVSGWKGMAFSLLPSGFLLWVGMMALRLVGNLYGMEGAAAVSREGGRIQGAFGEWVTWARKTMEQSSIGGMMTHLDPFSMRPVANLSRLLIVWPDQKLWPKLSTNPKTGKIYSHPKLLELGKDPAVRTCIEKKDYAGLMQLPQVEKVAAHPDLEPLLNETALEDAMDQIIYGKEPNKK